MQNKKRTIAFYELLQTKDLQQIKEYMEPQHPATLASLITALTPEEKLPAFRVLSTEKAAETFSFLQPEDQKSLLQALSDAEAGHILEDMNVDDAVDMLEDLPANVVKRLLRIATPETRAQLNSFMQYPTDSAGGIMTAEFISLKKDLTVGQALALIRKAGPDAETIYTCYVTSPSLVLEGVVTVRQLLLAGDAQIVGDIMEKEVVSAEVHTKTEKLVQLFQTYGFLALPVVDKQNRVVGIITIDDVLDAAQEESEADFERMAAITPSDKPYLKTSVWEHSKSRITWLLLLMLSGMVNGSILQKYEHAFVALPLLVTFIPMLTDTGGNAGSQSSTLVIRGIATDELRLSDLLQVLWKELRIGLLVGVTLAAVNFARIFFFYGGMENSLVALTVSLSVLGIVMLSKFIGSMLPLLVSRLKIDPAIMAAPLITTVVDAAGLIFYFTMAKVLLGI